MHKSATLILAGAALALSLGIPALAVDKPAADKATASRSAWPAESLSGRIDMVEPAQKVIVVESQDKVPYDIVITPRTRIMVGNQSVALKDLTRYQNKDVTVRFVPEGRGDMASTVRISG